MDRKSDRFIKRLLVVCYIQFGVCLLFWIGAALRWLSVEGELAYILMAVMLVANICMVLMAVMLDKFYVKDIWNNLTNLDELNNKLRSQRHDYLNEMQVVYGLLELGEYEDAVEYLKPIYADIAKTGKSLKTSKPAVNALLQAKLTVAQKQNITLFIDVSSDLQTYIMEQWDICRILSNLIDNAIAAVSLKSDTDSQKEVHVNFLESENDNIIIVYNNGPAIPKEKQELIFKRGYTSKKEEGHGMGLGIVKKIIDDNHGKIILKSDEKETSFEVRLPKNV